VLDLLPGLRLQGIEPVVVEWPAGRHARRQVFAEAGRHPVTVMQKRLLSWIDVRALRRHAKRLVYDFDDSVWCGQTPGGWRPSWSRRLKFAGIVTRADLVIAGNRLLAEEAGRLGARVAIVPSTVPVDGVPVRDHARAAGRTRLVWIGGGNNLRYLEALTPVWRRLARDHDVELRIISSRGLRIDGVETQHISWSEETQARELAACDIGVMPLPSDPHTRGKCAYKALQYMAAGLPVVASDVGITREVVRHGQDGFICEHEHDWIPALLRLCDDRNLRAACGKNARERVRESFSTGIAAEQLARALRGC
jgi:hypothetical protein